MKGNIPPIWLDIESGGLNPSESSILSIAAGQQGNIRSLYARPIPGTFLSRFSKENIIPQLQAQSSLQSEKQIISSFLDILEQNKSAPVAGYNIRGFDLGYIQRRSRIHGMERRYSSLMKGRPIIDPTSRVKDIVASSVMEHIRGGTFSSELEGLSWPEATARWGELPFRDRPQSFNLLSQVEGYIKSGSSGALFKGWKLEDISSLLGRDITGAHQAVQDINLTSSLLESLKSGELQEVFSRSSTATKWLDIQKNRGFLKYREGEVLTQQSISKMGLPSRFSTLNKAVMNLYTGARARPRLTAGIAAAVAIGGLSFSGRDDNYNTIEGLGHSGIAQEGRLQLTDFGSGWRGIVKLPNYLSGGASGKMIGVNTLLEHVAKTSAHLRGIHGDVWHKTQQGQELVALLKDARQAKHAGFEAVIAINIDKTKEVAALTGKSFSKLLKHTIAHERVHLGRALWRGDRPLTAIEPSSAFKQAMLKSPSYADKPQTWTEEYIANIAAVTRYPERAKFDTRLKDLWQNRFSERFKRASQIANSVTKISIRERYHRMHKYRDFIRSKISSREESNTIPGMRHGGLAEILRKKITSFGSPWDALRNLIKGKETFQQMLKSTGFQKALQSAKHVEELGAGQFATVHKMEATFRGQKFQFARKIGDVQAQEAETMGMFGEEFAPTVYSTGTKDKARYLDMELIQGKTFGTLAEEGTGVSAEVWKTHLQNIQKVHSAGYVHGDPHSGNVMLTPEGRVALIDWTSGGKIGTEAGLTRKGKTVYVNEMTTRNTATDIKILDESAGELASVGNRDTLADPLSYFTPKVKTSVARRKVSQANLQQSASKTSWGYGKSGGRRSRS